MTIQRPAAALFFVLALVALMPASALAGTLLSGYGGPGQGSQVILGSELVNVGKGGGGAAGGGSASGSTSSSQTSAVSTAAPATAPTVKRPRRAARSKAGGQALPTLQITPFAPKVGTSAYSSLSVAHAPTVAEASDPLGVSGSDLIYILVAAGALAFTGVLTRQFTTSTDRKSARD